MWLNISRQSKTWKREGLLVCSVANGFSHYKDRFEELNILKNKECLATFDDVSLMGLAEGITENGELILNENGKIHLLRYGDVSIRKI